MCVCPCLCACDIANVRHRSISARLRVVSVDRRDAYLPLPPPRQSDRLVAWFVQTLGAGAGGRGGGGMGHAADIARGERGGMEGGGWGTILQYVLDSGEVQIPLCWWWCCCCTVSLSEHTANFFATGRDERSLRAL